MIAHAPESQSHASKKLTVFLVTNNYTPFSGGVVSAIDSYAQELRALGHRPIIITLNFTGSQQSENDVIRLWCPVRFIYRTNHMALPWMSTANIEKLARTLKPDIIHTYHPFLLGACALRVGKQLRIPVIFSYLTLYDRYAHYIPLLPPCITQPIITLFVRNFCMKVDGLIVPGQSTKEYITAQGIKRDMAIIPLSILPVFIQQKYVSKTIVPKQRKILVCVSRFTPEKNLYFLLDMITHLESHTFTLVLIGFGQLEHELKQYAYNTLKLTEQDVMFIVKPDKQTICEWYHKAYLFVFASLSESQGLVLAEAMANSTPVVALQAPGVKDTVIHNKNGFMVADQGMMAGAITLLAQDHALYNQLSEYAWQSSKNYFPEINALHVLEVYRKFI